MSAKLRKKKNSGKGFQDVTGRDTPIQEMAAQYTVTRVTAIRPTVGQARVNPMKRGSRETSGSLALHHRPVARPLGRVPLALDA
jgi:hypothetical protein